MLPLDAVQMAQLIQSLIDSPTTQAALGILAAQGITELTEEIKTIIQNKYNQSIYAFVPNKEEAQQLRQFSKEPEYKQIQFIVPRYKYIDIIRTGLLVKSYHNRNGPGDNDRAIAIKAEISRRANGVFLVKLVKLPDAPFFNMILEKLYSLKTQQSYTEEQLNDKFEELITGWEQSAKYLENKDPEDTVERFCRQQIERNKETFWLLGMREVANRLERDIEDLREYFTENNYIASYKKIIGGNSPRLEVTVNKIF